MQERKREGCIDRKYLFELSFKLSSHLIHICDDVNIENYKNSYIFGLDECICVIFDIFLFIECEKYPLARMRGNNTIT